MENAVQALKMAAAVLIFIIAIASSFSLFGTAKQTADSIITMSDRQVYLDAAELDNGILYTSSTAVQGTSEELEDEEKQEESTIAGVTKGGDRIVQVEDVVSTILRYNKEKYGVTIMKENGEILARFDSSTEEIISLWNIIVDKEDGSKRADEQKEEVVEKIRNNISTSYVSNPTLEVSDLEDLYAITIDEGDDRGIKCGAPWYGREEQIQKRIACDLSGESYTYSGQTYNGDPDPENRKNLLSELNSASTNYIVEVTNEIDRSTYLEDDLDGDGIEDDNSTNLLQQYEMPTIEIVYIIM